MTLVILPRDGHLYDDITEAETNNLKKVKPTELSMGSTIPYKKFYATGAFITAELKKRFSQLDWRVLHWLQRVFLRTLQKSW